MLYRVLFGRGKGYLKYAYLFGHILRLTLRETSGLMSLLNNPLARDKGLKMSDKPLLEQICKESPLVSVGVLTADLMSLDTELKLMDSAGVRNNDAC